ncbi:MAG: archaemetzincin family Zn-dependent metalloprotease [Thermoleophilia bacterium]
MKSSLLITPFNDLADGDDPGRGGHGRVSELLAVLGAAASAAFGFAVVSRTATGELQPHMVSSVERQPAEPFPEPLPTGAFDSRRGQYAAVGLLAFLARRTESGLAVLGVTGVDLFAPRLNFVFGMADRAAGTAVISMHRLTPEFYGEAPDPVLSRERAAKEAVHELGHVLGLAHCSSSGCIMRFSSTIEDTDDKDTGFCGRCAANLTPITRL